MERENKFPSSLDLSAALPAAGAIAPVAPFSARSFGVVYDERALFRHLWEKLKTLWTLAKSERATPREIGPFAVIDDALR